MRSLAGILVVLLFVVTPALAQQDQPLVIDRSAGPAPVDLTLDPTAQTLFPHPTGAGVDTPACDDFNRANSTNMGPDWTEISGDFEVFGNQCRSVANLSYMVHTATSGYAGTVLSFDLDGTATSLVYSAAVIGHNSANGESIFVKIQNQSGAPGYNTYGFYHGNNGGSFGSWGGFRAFPAQVPGGRVTVSVDNTGDVVTLDIDYDWNGVPDFTDTAPGLIASGLAALLSNGAGFGGYGTELSDNWELDGGCAAGIVEIPAMTVPHNCIGMMNLPLGPVTLGQLNNSAAPGPANMTAVNLTLSAAAPGIYSTNLCGQALALLPGGGPMGIIEGISGTAPFDSFNASIFLGQPSTEFGIDIGDWIGPLIMDFWSGGSIVATHTSSNFGTCPGTLYFQMTSGTFDRVDMQASTPFGNWVITELCIEGPTPPPCGRLAITSGGCYQRTTFTITGLNPFDRVNFFGSPNLVPTPVPGGALFCAGTVLDIGTRLKWNNNWVRQADGAGVASITAPVAKATSGCMWYVQVVAEGTGGGCCTTNVVQLL